MRRLLLHMGLAKTGSTAIQHWSVWNRDWLRQHGVRYPEHRSDEKALRGESMPGNGDVALPFISGMEHHNPAAAKRGMAAVLAKATAGDAPVTLLSNEKMFGQFRPEHLSEVRRHLAAEGITLQAVVYLRDIAGHAVSAYAQRVKQIPITSTLWDYLTDESAPERLRYKQQLRPPLEHLLEVLGEENLTVRHYDTHRHALVEDFLTHVLGITDRDGTQDPPSPVANRSLTLREIEWKRHLNTKVRDRGKARFLGRRLAMLPAPDGDRRLNLTDSGLAYLEDRFGDEVAWTNRQFFGAEPVLSVSGGASPVAEAEQPLELTDEERRLLDWFAFSHAAQE